MLPIMPFVPGRLLRLPHHVPLILRIVVTPASKTVVGHAKMIATMALARMLASVKFPLPHTVKMTVAKSIARHHHRLRQELEDLRDRACMLHQKDRVMPLGRTLMRDLVEPPRLWSDG